MRELTICKFVLICICSSKNKNKKIWKMMKIIPTLSWMKMLFLMVASLPSLRRSRLRNDMPYQPLLYLSPIYSLSIVIVAAEQETTAPREIASEVAILKSPPLVKAQRPWKPHTEPPVLK